MTTALIGHSGFVGGNLLRQTRFDELYRSTNIGEIRGKSFDLVVCAGAPAVKWQANQEPEKDQANLEVLMDALREIKVKDLILISTVDVYRMPPAVDEETPIDPALLDPYGRHRFFLEEFVRSRFENYFIVRLPGLFGQGLKKNFIYDLLHNNCPEWTDGDSIFQFYDLENLWADLQRIQENKVSLINLATAPVKAADVARACFQMEFTNKTEKPPVFYDMRTRFACLFGKEGDYISSKEETFNRLRRFIKAEKASINL
ncbi:MAG: NAD-dependent epimerase/dehydratase family protein [Thermodesulfobacteriota bacterium]